MVADGFALQIILNFQLTHSLTHSFTFEQWTFFFVPTDQFSSHFENTFAIETNKTVCQVETYFCYRILFNSKIAIEEECLRKWSIFASYRLCLAPLTLRPSPPSSLSFTL